MYNSGAKQYQQVNVTSEVLDADPHRLIQLLLEAALTRMSQAKGAIERKDYEEKASLLGRVNTIIESLQGSLDHDAGGDVSRNLERLYDYMNRRLITATARNDVTIIDEVMGLMLQVKEGWDGIREEYLKGLAGSSSAVSATAGDPSARLSSHISA